MKRLVANKNMQIIYAQQEFPDICNKSIYLAGPTPRDKKNISWRKEALEILQKLNYNGTVYVPEFENSVFKDHDAQIKWERKAMNKADVIVFWMCREMRNDFENIALTSNIEFGEWFKSGKVVLGFPKDAPKMDYIKNIAPNQKIKIFNDLKSTLTSAIEFIGEGAERILGETDVPLYIWNTPTFQQWYKAQTAVGNELRYADVQYTYRPMPKKDFVFLWILYVQVFIKSENRIKDNELVLSRTNMSSALLYRKGKDLMDTKIVLVKEYRSSCVNKEVFVYELPGGSAKDSTDKDKIVCEEISQETGIEFDISKLSFEGTRQVMSTLSAHQVHLYSIELNDEDMGNIEANMDKIFGVEEDSERTTIHIKTIQEILNEELLDWSNIGMIMSVLNKK